MLEKEIFLFPERYTAWFKLRSGKEWLISISQAIYRNFPDQPNFVRSVE
jgi:hypothetical protein